MFRGVFGRSRIDLDLDTAHEILMRVGRTLDPVPVTERMWSAYLSLRRPLRYSGLDSGAAAGQDVQAVVDGLVAQADGPSLPADIAADLLLLLRLETLLQMWAAGGGQADTEFSGRRPEILAALHREVARYLEPREPDPQVRRQVIDDVISALRTTLGAPAFGRAN